MSSATGLSWSGSANTGFFRPATSTLAISTAGTERMRVDSAGSVGIGNSNPVSALQVGGYIQLPVVSGVPSAVACAGAADYGRMAVDPATTINKIYLCAADGWQYLTGNLLDNCQIQTGSFNVAVSMNGISGTLTCGSGYTKLVTGGCHTSTNTSNFRASYESPPNTWNCMADNKSGSVVLTVNLYAKCCR